MLNLHSEKGVIMSKLRIGSQVTSFAGDGMGAVAYVPPEQHPEQLWRSFDAERTIECLREAIAAVENADGIAATNAAGEAWARICLFHRHS